MSAGMCIVYAKFRCAPLRIKKALGIFREITRRTTTRLAFWDPPYINITKYEHSQRSRELQCLCLNFVVGNSLAKFRSN